MQLFILKSQLENDRVRLFEDQVHYVLRVCRLKRAERLDFVIEHSLRLTVLVRDISEPYIFFDVLEKQVVANQSNLVLNLVQGCPKQDKMTDIINMSVQGGITSVYPLITSRCVVDYPPSKREQKVSRWKVIAQESARQSQRTFIPDVLGIQDFKSFITSSSFSDWDLKLVFWEEAMLPLKDVLSGVETIPLDTPYRIGFVIGPEGGISKDEVEQLKEVGFISVSLGKTILRTENAGFYALAQLLYHFS